jgi:uncharacterized protein
MMPRARTNAASLAVTLALSAAACAPPPATPAPTRAAAATAPPATPPPEGGRPVTIGTSYTLPSAVLKETRRINVYLPEGYADATKTFPVLYLLDGGEKEDFHHITGLVALETQNGFTREAIVVGIADTDRKHDFTSPSSDPRDRAEVPTHGGAAAFRKFLGTELRPWVTAHLRTNGESVVIGESLAALFIVETFLREPALFDGYIAISPSLWWDKGSLANEADARIRAMPAGKRALYLSIGDEGGGMRSGVDQLVASLNAHPPDGLTWKFEPRPTESHGTVYQPAAQAALRVLFAAPKAKHAP